MFVNFALSLVLFVTGARTMADLSGELGPDYKLSSEDLRRLDRFAELCAHQGLNGKAAEAYEIALKKAHQTTGDNHRDIAQIHLLLAGAYRSLGDNDKAIFELEQCLTTSQQALGPINMLTAVALNQLGMLAADQSEEAKAESFYQRSLDMLDRLGEKAKITAAAVLMNLGLLYYHQADQAKAMPFFERCLKTIDELSTPETADTAQMLNTLAWAHFEMMHYEAASSLMQRGLEIREKVLGPSHPDLADSFDLLARFASDTGNYSRALAWLKLSLSFRQKAFGTDHKLVAKNLSDLGDTYASQGNYAEALAKSIRALEIREKIFGPAHHEVAASLLQVACLKSKFWRQSEALDLAQRALDIELKQHGPQHPHIANCLENLAGFHIILGNTVECTTSLGRCLQIREKAFGSTSLITVETFEAFALLGICIGQDELPHLKIALTRKEHVLGKENPAIVTSLNNLGRVCRERGQFLDAAGYLERALTIALQAWGADHPGTLAIQREILLLKLRQNTPLKNCLEAVTDLLKSERDWLAKQLLGLSAPDALASLHMLISDMTILHSLSAIASGKEALQAHKMGAEQASLSKAFYEELLITGARLESNPSTQTRELQERWYLLNSELRKLPGIEPNPGQRERRRREGQEKLDEIEVELHRRSGLADLGVASRSLPFESLAQRMPQGAVLCDFCQYWRFDGSGPTNQRQEARYAAYLTFPLANDSTNVIVERVDLGEAALINEALGVIAKRFSALPAQYRAKDVQPALQKLSDLVYAPLAKHLTDVSHIIVCPDGQLSRLPFEMLPVGDKFLVEEKTISYVTSGREVVRLAKPLTRPAATLSPSDGERVGRGGDGKSLVMGNPDFDLDLRSSRGDEALTKDSAIGNPKPEIDVSFPTSAATKSLSRDYRGLNFKPLPGAEIEARGVAKLLGDDTTLRLGAEAREAVLKAVKSPRVLHLATHGFFLSDQEFKQTNALGGLLAANTFGTGSAFGSQRIRGTRWNASLPENDWENPLVRCGIALAGANRAHQITNAIAEDGLLTGLEASLLNLQGTELVILSACDSGSREVRIGEGVMSLRRAFRIAGAETVLASHWTVSDKATSQLMTEFMRRWRSGEPRAKAWREAQLTLLRSKGAKEDFSDPYFWSAFTLTGQWR